MSYSLLWFVKINTELLRGVFLIDISNFLLIHLVSDYERMRRTYFRMNVVLKGTVYFGIYD